MKNVTIAVEESLLRDARRIAAARSASLNSLIREYLEHLTAAESRAMVARERILELSRGSTAEVGRRDWIRDDLHER
jgi:hypothetical protein